MGKRKRVIPEEFGDNFIEALAFLREMLKRDFASAAEKGLSGRELRYLFDTYYQMQEDRKRTDNQARSAGEEPVGIIDVFGSIGSFLETTTKALMEAWATKHAPNYVRWAYDRKGLGETFATGLYVFIDMSVATTVSKVWRIAGLDPTVEWLGREKGERLVAKAAKDHKGSKPEDLIPTLAAKTNRNALAIHRSAMRLGKGKITMKSLRGAIKMRPWNARFKSFCWKIGDSFCKNKNRGSFYGFLYAGYKAELVEKNESGAFRETAKECIASGRNYSADHKATYRKGMLPKAQIERRARRKAVKLFLSHYWIQAYRDIKGKEPPKPYIIEHGGHADIIMPEDAERFEQEAINARKDGSEEQAA
jgi:hypothetical protein